MEKKVSIPDGIQVEVENFKVLVTGEKGKLEKYG